MDQLTKANFGPKGSKKTEREALVQVDYLHKDELGAKFPSHGDDDDDDESEASDG
jgi:hypothetical protein